MREQEGVIGTSLLEYLDHGSISNQDLVIKDEVDVSMVHSLLNKDLCDGRILLKGSHASSLAMDFAHSVAGGCTCAQPTCCCQTIHFLTHESKKKIFPILCQETPIYNDDFHTKLKCLGFNKSWNQRALRRIQVHFFNSSRDLIDHMLNLKVGSHQARGAIIIDGVERFVRSNSGVKNNDIGTEEAMQITKILAILADTGTALKPSGGHSMHVIATIQINVPMNVERIFRKWFLHVIKIDDDDMVETKYMIANGVIMASFSVNVEQQTIEGVQLVDQRHKFSLLQKQDGTKLIVWNNQQSD